MNQPTQGYLLMAVGRRRFLDMAADLVLSLRRFDARPVALATDEALGILAASEYPGLFDRLLIVPDYARHHRALKFCAADITPFDETVYIDVDCLVLRSPEALWTGAGESPITMTGELLTPDSRDRWHQGFRTADIMRRLGLEAYLKVNGGVVHFRKADAGPLFDECHACYRDVVLGVLWDGRTPAIGLGDEFAFAIVGGRHRFSTFPSPNPTLWTREVADLDLDANTKPILHFIAPVPPRVLDRLMAEVEGRRRAAGFHPTLSIEEWRREAAPQSAWRRLKRRIYRLVRSRPSAD